MRTTIRFEEQLLVQAKKLAADRGITLTALVEDTLRETLNRRKPTPRRPKVRLTTAGRGGIRQNVDLDDSAGLVEIMERRDGAD